MLTILFKNTKDLIITHYSRIYQGEANVDTMKIYCPETYDDLDLTTYTATLSYLNPNNTAITEVLETVESDKEGYIEYNLPTDSDYTNVVGINQTQLILTYYDEADETSHVLKSGVLNVEVLPKIDYFAYTDDDKLDSLANYMLHLQAIADAIVSGEGSLEDMPTDLTIDESVLKLIKRTGATIGNGVKVLESEQDSDEVLDGIVDLSKLTIDD